MSRAVALPREPFAPDALTRTLAAALAFVILATVALMIADGGAERDACRWTHGDHALRASCALAYQAQGPRGVRRLRMETDDAFALAAALDASR